ncbi:MAG TPA: hypothetical protein VJ901_07505 [Thermoanaerobaculia bacterium]|nr:hypothetical protein [Thermoanaerobaculia bacterium]
MVLSYDFWRGETSLIDPRPAAADDELRRVTRAFASASSSARAEMRDDMSMNDFYSLLTFARRASVFAMRSKDAQWITDALNGIAIIDAHRIDASDIPRALSVVHHAAERIGIDAKKKFEAAASLADRNPAELIRSFVRGDEKYKDLRRSWGHDEIVTAAGVGFISREFSPYNPSGDMATMAVAIAHVLSGDHYEPGTVAIASKLPAAWFRTDDETGLQALLRHVRAGLTVHGRLRPDQRPLQEMHTLMVFAIELEDASFAEQLMRIAASHPPREERRLTIREKALFCMAIAESADEPYESTPERFRAPLQAIFATY